MYSENLQFVPLAHKHQIVCFQQIPVEVNLETLKKGKTKTRKVYMPGHIIFIKKLTQGGHCHLLVHSLNTHNELGWVSVGKLSQNSPGEHLGCQHGLVGAA